MSEPSLFGDDATLDPSTSAQSRLAAMLLARTEAYGRRLFQSPPIRSCDELQVGQAAAVRNCDRFAKTDTARVLAAERAAGLTIVSIDRLAALEQALRDHLQLHDDDIATGGNGSEDIDLDELMSRTQALLDATTLIAPSDVRATIVLPTSGGTS